MVDFSGLFGKNDKQNPWTPKGELASEKGLYEDAALYFSKAVEHEPSNPLLWTKLGDSQKCLLKYENASRAYIKAVELDPENRHAWINLALILASDGKYEEALSAVNHVVLPESEAYLKDLKCEWLQKCGKYKEAASVCSHLMSANPTNILYKKRYAELLMRAGSFEEAKRYFDDLSSEPGKGRYDLISDAGFCCEMMGDVEGAIKRYSQLAEDDSLGWYRRARLEESRGNFKDAATAYGMVQHYSAGNDVTVNVRRALCLFWNANGKEAANQLEKVLSKGYASPELWYLMGVVAFMNGSMKRAVSSFDEYIHLNHANNTVWYMKGCAEFLSGRYSEALDSFARMDKLNASSSAPGKMKWFAESADMDLFDEDLSPAKDNVKVEVGITNEGLLTMQAYSLFVLGRYADADKIAKNLLAEFPQRTDIELLHGKCLRETGRYKDASDASALVIAKEPENIEALMQYASCNAFIGKYEQAKGAWNKIKELAPENIASRAGVIASDMGCANYASAKENAEAFLENFAPGDLTSTFNAGYASFACGNYENAIKHYTNAVNSAPNVAEGYMGLGNSLEMLARYDEAASVFETACENVSENPACLISLARTLSLSEKKEAAVEIYKRVLNEYPEIPGTCLRVAKLCFELGRYDEAADAAILAVSQGNTSFDLFTLAGDSCFAAGRLEDAAECYNKATEIIPNDVRVLTALSKIYLSCGLFNEAVEVSDGILAVEPQNKNALTNKAEALASLGNLEGAERVYRDLVEAYPTAAPAILALADVLEQQYKYDEALEVYAAYLGLEAENLTVIRKLTEIYLIKGEFEEALSGYEILLDKNPSDATIKRLKAQALCYIGEYEKAAELFGEAIALGGDADMNMKLKYALSLGACGDSEGALREYSDVLRYDISNSSALFGCADMYMRLGKYPESIKVFNKIIEKYPRNGFAYLEKSSAAVKIGEPKDVAESFAQALATNPRNPYILSGIGFLQMISGKPLEALATFDKAEAAGCTDLDIVFCKGLIFIEQKKFEPADKCASEILKRDASNISAWHLKARALDALGKTKEAYYCFNKVIELSESAAPEKEEEEAGAEKEGANDFAPVREYEREREPEETKKRSVNGFSFDF